jgi:hypothetical protein
VPPVLTVLKLIPGAKPELIESSCCGMAGSSATRRRTTRCRCRWPRLSLLPAVRAQPDALIVADGTSCRHQIADGAGRQALHVARCWPTRAASARAVAISGRGHMVQRLQHQGQVEAGVGGGHALCACGNEVEPLQRVRQVLGMLPLIDLQRGDAAARMALQQRARQLRRAAAEFDDALAVQRHHRRQQVQLVVYQLMRGVHARNVASRCAPPTFGRCYPCWPRRASR